MALLALALQLVLAFGHVHGLHPDRPAPALTVAAGNAPAPANNPADTDDNDYCAICAILALLTGAQTATAPALAPPPSVASAEQPNRLSGLLAQPQRVAFRSRAPPQA